MYYNRYARASKIRFQNIFIGRPSSRHNKHTTTALLLFVTVGLHNPNNATTSFKSVRAKIILIQVVVEFSLHRSVRCIPTQVSVYGRIVYFLAL